MAHFKCPALALVCLCGVTNQSTAQDPRPHLKIRGIYGGVPVELLARGTLHDSGVNAIFMGSGSINAERLALLRKQGAKVFVEFNTMHVAAI